MIESTSRWGKSQVKTHLASWLAALAGRAGTRLHARDDLNALEHGWQITRLQGGLGRRYRDPRFDTIGSSSPYDDEDTTNGEPRPPVRRTGLTAGTPSLTGGTPSLTGGGDRR